MYMTCCQHEPTYILLRTGVVNSDFFAMQRGSRAAEWLALARAHRYWPEAPTHMRVAAEALEVALHLAPRSAQVWSMAADVYHELSRSNFSFTLRAIQCCRASLRLRPQGADAVAMWMNFAKVLSEAGFHEQAVAATERALHADDSFPVQSQAADALIEAR